MVVTNYLTLQSTAQRDSLYVLYDLDPEHRSLEKVLPEDCLGSCLQVVDSVAVVGFGES